MEGCFGRGGIVKPKAAKDIELKIDLQPAVVKQNADACQRQTCGLQADRE
jgi:hypothetical protein